MTYGIRFSEKALQEFKRLEPVLQDRMISVLGRIRVRPERYLKRLVNDPAYKLRVGDYRLLLDLNKRDSVILVLKIGHRSDIYKP